jgi:predicted transcriptional regulator
VEGEPTLKDVLEELKRLRAEIKVSNKAMLTVIEAAEYLGLSPKTIRNGVGPKAKDPFPIKPCRVGKRVFFRRSDLDRFVGSLGETK